MSKAPTKRPARRDDRRPQQTGGSIAWYLVAVALGTLLIVSLLAKKGSKELPYSDFVALISQIGPDKPQEQASLVLEEDDKKYRFSAPDKLKIGPTDATGTLKKEEVVADAASPGKYKTVEG